MLFKFTKCLVNDPFVSLSRLLLTAFRINRKPQKHIKFCSLRHPHVKISFAKKAFKVYICNALLSHRSGFTLFLPDNTFKLSIRIVINFLF